MWVVIDGLDGTGKDTVIEKLKEQYPDWIYVKDPSPLVASEIRQVLLDKELSDITRLYLYLAARVELLHKEILPALKAGNTVICNRYSFSTYAYQGSVIDQNLIHQASDAGCLEDYQPDKTILLLGDRFADGDNVMDDFCDDKRESITENFLELAQQHNNVHVVWVNRKSKEEVYREVVQLLDK